MAQHITRRTALVTLLVAVAFILSRRDIAAARTAAAAAPEDAVLLFDIGMHIEPLGATPSALIGMPARPAGTQGPDYHNPAFFTRQIADIRAVAGIVEAHGGRMTVQAQTPFTTVAADRGDTTLRDLEAAGHEIGLHFHEDAHLGRNSTSLSADTWCAVMREEIDAIRATGVQGGIRYWSGGNLYPGVLDAAACAGLTVNSDWKNPRTQRTDLTLTGVNPWRPAGGPSEEDLTAFARHDPAGPIVFLPEGIHTTTAFASMRRSPEAGGDEAYFAYLRTSLEASLAEAWADRVNAAHFTVHPGEFRGDPAHPFAVIDRFLTEVVDPLVRTGRVRWATFSEMAGAFEAWERANPGVDPRVTALPSATAMAMAPTPEMAAATVTDDAVLDGSAPVETTTAATEATTAETGSRPVMTFVVNVHDTTHVDESAATVLRLIDLYERYGVRGDFYLTAPIVQAYAASHPEVIARLRDSGMGINYHVRPPHPLWPGFEDRLRNLSDSALEAALRDYETHALDPLTGATIPDQPGGYQYVADTFGRPPAAVGAATGDRRIKRAALRLYAALGAKVAVQYHECCADPVRPYEYVEGLLTRPSDISVTRWNAAGRPGTDGGPFWWNMLATSRAAAYDPVAFLQDHLSAWHADRAPFVTQLIHENNFTRSGPEGWTAMYYDGGDKGRPLPPPYDPSAPDLSRPRSPAEQEAIWSAYERLVAYAAANLRVLTADDIGAVAAAAAS